MSAASPKLLITPGEPAGIGPELVLRAAASGLPCPSAAIACPKVLQHYIELLELPVSLHVLTTPSDVLSHKKNTLNVIAVPTREKITPGTLEKNNAEYVINTLALANDLCVKKEFDAVVTGPVQKSVINDAGIAFSGHTEFFAERSHTPKVVMMLATEGLRVALATTHLPLKDVASAITHESLHEVITILIRELTEKFAIQNPKILVAGLNPHAGEGGHLGMEEIDTIIPVMESFKHSPATLIGPLPADTLFTPHHLNQADAVLAMYHDQGLPVLKHKGFGKAVNITLGLPYIRTSVDHGTALDLAGKGSADMGSLLEALHIAHELASHHI